MFSLGIILFITTLIPHTLTSMSCPLKIFSEVTWIESFWEFSSLSKPRRRIVKRQTKQASSRFWNIGWTNLYCGITLSSPRSSSAQYTTEVDWWPLLSRWAGIPPQQVLQNISVFSQNCLWLREGEMAGAGRDCWLMLVEIRLASSVTAGWLTGCAQRSQLSFGQERS